MDTDENGRPYVMNSGKGKQKEKIKLKIQGDDMPENFSQGNEMPEDFDQNNETQRFDRSQNTDENEEIKAVESDDYGPLKLRDPPKPIKIPSDAELSKTIEDQYFDVYKPPQLDKICICGKPAGKICSACKTKNYCGRSCQLIDRHIHRKICRPYAIISATYDLPNSDSEKVLKQRNVANEPQWKRFVEIIYATLRKTALENYSHDHQERGEFYTSWLRILDDFNYGEMPSDTIVGFFYLSQEPDRLFMFVVKDEDRRKAVTQVVLKQADVVFKTTKNIGRSIMYTIPIEIPNEYTFMCNWDLQPYNNAPRDQNIDSDSD